MDEIEYQIELTRHRMIIKKLTSFLVRLVDQDIENLPVYRKKEFKSEIREYLKKLK